MLSLKDLIIYIFIFIFMYLIIEYFYSLSPKIIETFDLSENVSSSNNIISFKDIPSKLDFNFTQVGDLKSVQNSIEDLKIKQNKNQQTLESLRKQLGVESSSN